MRVAEDGRTETQVFEGKVRILPTGAAASTIVKENETFAVNHSGAVRSAGVKDSMFVTHMPPRAEERMEYVHWPMDDGKGSEVATLLPGGRADPVSGKLRAFGAKEELPSWIDGAFGKGLSFDGQGQALETFHQGPDGDAARTIAFWVRVPLDFDPAQGFGVISWGKLRMPGAAWQISMDPYGKKEYSGRLRVGTGNSAVVGVTDLRDGRWHHCAVVLYRDEQKPDRFPILLYVDGRMEVASAKAVYGVRTNSGEDARPIWMGRSLAHGQENRTPQGTGFFRGDLDEMYVFEGALNRMQIQRLMLENRPPGE